MEIEIKVASTKLLDKLYHLETECFNEEAFTKQQIAYLLTDYNAIALIAEVNNEIVGFIIVQIEVSQTEYGHIITINVASRYRRMGIGTKMLTEIEKHLKQRSITECFLEVQEDNNAAIKLYHKIGYQTVRKIEKYYGKKNALYLKKSLKN